jgi:hypothetical protein
LAFQNHHPFVLKQYLHLLKTFIYFEFQSTFIMSNKQKDLDTLQDIKRIMERSSRFISLSGWSGVSAGICALLGAGFAYKRISHYYAHEYLVNGTPAELKTDLIVIAMFTFLAAFMLASFFTFLRSKKEGVAIWGTSARRLMWNTLLPLIAGGLLLWHMIELKQYEFLVSTSLIFYGLALINGSKYTMGEVRWLGYGELLLGLISLWVPHMELFFWSLGFGILHILYGIAMWWKYERGDSPESEIL